MLSASRFPLVGLPSEHAARWASSAEKICEELSSRKRRNPLGNVLYRLIVLAAGCLAAIAVWAANGTSITSYGPFVTSSTATRLYRFEPSSAAGSTWATSWSDTGGTDNWFISTWDPN